jgi:hypothetical protein
MRRGTILVFALLALAACADNTAATAEDSGGGAGDTAEPQGMQQGAIGAAGMGAPEPAGTSDASDATPPATEDDATPATTGQPAADSGDDDQTGSGSGEGAREAADPSESGTADGDSSDADSAGGDAGAAPTSPSPTTPPTAPAGDTTPPLASLADLEPSPNNIPECPATAPENPWGPCVGVPVYAVCEYGEAPAPLYSCICDWIHWICVGVQ